MKVTICELSNDTARLNTELLALGEHMRAEHSEFVLLPEMPFSAWFASTPAFDNKVWHDAQAAHDAGIRQLNTLSPAVVASTRPITKDQHRFNEGFVWQATHGYQAAHHKYYLPEEDGFWEASWYERGDGSFNPIHMGAVSVGFLICSELWFFERARAYGKAGADILLTPRCTEHASVEKWVMGGRAAAICAGAFSLSSNRVGSDMKNVYGGGGWVVDPDGNVLGVTTTETPFLTIEIDLAQARTAKRTYPRYIKE